MEDYQILVQPEQNRLLREQQQTLVIGQEFADVDTCRRAVKDMAIALHYELRAVKSDFHLSDFARGAHM
jgi:hypothetical protein